MGQKIHPLGLRIGITQLHHSCWFAKPRKYALLVKEDHAIRDYVKKRFPHGAVSKLYLNRQSGRLNIEIITANVVEIIARDGMGLENLRNEIETRFEYANDTIIHVSDLEQPELEANLIADVVVQDLEKRVAFRRAMKNGLQRAKRAEGAQGIKIQVSGRLNGAEIARTEWIRDGRVPLQTLRADIDYTHRTAKTIYGILGIKVWIFRGEVESKLPIQLVALKDTFSAYPKSKIPKKEGAD